MVTETTMTERELTAFADKLEGFGRELSSKEQLIFLEILLRAGVAEDVEGHTAGIFPRVKVAGLQSLQTSS
jgi:hypothetical protein